MITTPREARAIREDVGLTVPDLARLFRLGEEGEKLVQRWEAGSVDITGPASLLYDLLRDGTLDPDPDADCFLRALPEWRFHMAKQTLDDFHYDDPFEAEADAPADYIFTRHPAPRRTAPQFYETFMRFQEEHRRQIRLLDGLVNLKTDDLHDLIRIEAWCINLETLIIEVLWELQCARIALKDPNNANSAVYQSVLKFEEEVLLTLRDLHAVRTGKPLRLLDIIDRAMTLAYIDDRVADDIKRRMH